MKEIKVNELTDNLFETISKEWMLVTAGTKEQIQHYDGKLGRYRISMEPSGSLYLYPPRALYIRLYRAE